MSTFSVRGALSLAWLLSISYGWDSRPYENTCKRTYVELVCTYNVSDGTFVSTVGMSGGFPLARTVNRTIRSTDSLVSTEDLSEELNFTLRQESVVKKLTSLRISGVASLSYLCQIIKADCGLTCTLGSHSFIFVGTSAFALGGSSHPQMVDVCRKALSISVFHSQTFFPRWMRICERVHSIPTRDYGTLDFSYGENSSLATCSFRSSLPIRFGLRIQNPDNNVTVNCRQRSDLNVSCLLHSDIENVTNPRALRCCTFSALTKHHCVGLRKDVGAGLSTISLGGIDRVFDGPHVAVPIVLSFSVVISVMAIVVLLRKRWRLHVLDGFAGRNRFRFAYRPAISRRRGEGGRHDLKRSE